MSSESGSQRRLEPQEVVAGRYELTERLARGGMGEVFAALDRSTGKSVALKRLLGSALSQRAVVVHFMREYHALSGPCGTRGSSKCRTTAWIATRPTTRWSCSTARIYAINRRFGIARPVCICATWRLRSRYCTRGVCCTAMSVRATSAGPAMVAASCSISAR